MKRSYRVVAWAAVIAGALSVVACSHKKDDGTAPVADDKGLPPLTIRDDTPSLMLTWIDDKGDTHVEMRPADVPASGRGMVRVIVSDREEGTRDPFYVVDLNQKDGEGGYTARSMRRRDWEGEIEKRRAAYLAKVAPPPPPSSSAEPDEPKPGKQAELSGLTVIIYGASWCKPCHQAQDYLRSKGVRVIMKDVEQTPGAQEEMIAKLQKSGRRGGGIPVIDVRGQILVGFNERTLDRALAKAQSGTVL